MRVIQNGKTIEIPRELEAKGGQAVQAFVDEQAGPRAPATSKPTAKKAATGQAAAAAPSAVAATEAAPSPTPVA